jgi:CheY-like chemotaxis protein
MTDNRQHRLSILVVEDNSDIRLILKDLLMAIGYDVSVAEDGEAGLSHLQNSTFDLMITDLGLPGMSGWDLARASKRYQSNMPILAISSWQGKGAEEKIGEFGIFQVIWKPFRFNQIQDAIDKIVLPCEK